MKGTIKSLSDKKFGFVKGTNGVEYFFHRDDFSGFWDDLFHDFHEGLKSHAQIEVTFEPGQGLKGPRASNVKRLDFPNQ